MLDSKTSAKATILAVDDSPIVLNVIRKALGETYTVVTTSDPTQALSMLYHQSIALLLLDVTMPDIDGLELCRTIRNLPQFVDLPIVMLTARDGAFDRVQGRRAGASEYLTKPFDDQVLLDVAARFIPST